MSRFNVRIEGHYEVNDLSYGRDYVWTPTRTTRPVRAAAPTTWLCYGRWWSVTSGEEILHPWHPEYEDWRRFKEDGTEYQEWLELQFLDEDWRKNAREARKE